MKTLDISESLQKITASQNTESSLDPQGVAKIVYMSDGGGGIVDGEISKVLNKHKGDHYLIDQNGFEDDVTNLIGFILKDNKGKEVFTYHQREGFVLVVAIPKGNIAKFKKEVEAV